MNAKIPEKSAIALGKCSVVVEAILSQNGKNPNRFIFKIFESITTINSKNIIKDVLIASDE